MKKWTAWLFLYLGLALYLIGAVVAALSWSIQALIGLVIATVALLPLSIGMVWHGIWEEREGSK